MKFNLPDSPCVPYRPGVSTGGACVNCGSSPASDSKVLPCGCTFCWLCYDRGRRDDHLLAVSEASVSLLGQCRAVLERARGPYTTPALADEIAALLERLPKAVA